LPPHSIYAILGQTSSEGWPIRNKRIGDPPKNHKGGADRTDDRKEWLER
jgi:hypothetical protein